MTGPKLLSVSVLGPEQALYKGQALSVSAINDTGKFDILPSHSHFISLIQDTLTIRVGPDNEKNFDHIHGVIRCCDDTITIYLGI